MIDNFGLFSIYFGFLINVFTYFDDSTGLSKLVMDDFYTMRNSLTSLLDQTITINNFTTVFVSRLLIGQQSQC